MALSVNLCHPSHFKSFHFSFFLCGLNIQGRTICLQAVEGEASIYLSSKFPPLLQLGQSGIAFDLSSQFKVQCLAGPSLAHRTWQRKALVEVDGDEGGGSDLFRLQPHRARHTCGILHKRPPSQLSALHYFGGCCQFEAENTSLCWEIPHLAVAKQVCNS